MSSLFDLTGRVVLATGGRGGIGLGFLTGCARQGAEGVIWDTEGSGQESALAQLKRSGAGRTHFERVDVWDEGQS